MFATLRTPPSRRRSSRFRPTVDGLQSRLLLTGDPTGGATVCVVEMPPSDPPPVSDGDVVDAILDACDLTDIQPTEV